MKLPRLVHAYVDRHGRPRYYLRRKGYQHVALPGLPWSPTFMAAYEEALAGQPPIQPGRANVKPGTMKALALSYFASPAFVAELKPASQRAYRGAIERFCNRCDANEMLYGEKLARDMQRNAVIKLIAARSHQTRSANFLLNMLRILMAHAIELGWRTDNPARDVKRLKVRSDGFHSWTEDEITQFRVALAYWNSGTISAVFAAIHRPARTFRTCPVWGASISKMACSGLGNRRPVPSLCFRCQHRFWRQ